MRIIKPPKIIEHNGIVVFAGGSIEMGKAEPWQQELEKFLDDLPESKDIVLLNPRRDDWNNTWKQDKNDSNFNYQVNWELDGLEYADLVLFYFSPGTNSIVSMLELGSMLGLDTTDVLVCCPPDYCRKGNIDIFCDRFGIPVFDSKKKWHKAIAEAITAIDNPAEQ